jgi:hypothetical protein
MFKSLLISAFLLLAASFAHGQACGPPSYECFNRSISVVPYVIPGNNQWVDASWGPNVCDATSIYSMAQCGNLTGANTCHTPADFGNQMCRATDIKTDVIVGSDNPKTQWQTADEPSVNLWNNDDTAMMLHVVGGNQFVFLFNPVTMVSTMVTPVISFPSGTVWSKSARDQIYTLDNTTGPGIYLQQNVVDLHVPSTGVSTSQLFDFAGTNCLANSVNGTAGAGDTFPLNQWTGAISSEDGNTFGTAFSLLPGQGSGYYAVIWTRGQNGCDVWNTLTGVVTHTDGTPPVTTNVGTMPDTQFNGPSCPGGSCGGRAGRMKIHDENMANSTTMALSSGAANRVYGSYIDGPLFWVKGTANILWCGINAINWVSGKNYNGLGNLIIPTSNVTNPGGFMYQIINNVAGTSGTTEPSWNQTPGGDTSDSVGTTQPLTWRNIGIGPNQQYFCDGHNWKGFQGIATGKQYTYHSYVRPQFADAQGDPLLVLGGNAQSAGDQHFGNTNANATDTNWIFVSSTDYGTTTDILHGTLPSALYMEDFFVAPPYCTPGVLNTTPCTLGQVRRAAHCFGTGWHQAFDVQNCMGIVSQTGNFMMLATDFFGTNGSTKGTINQPNTWLSKCNPGGPKWHPSDNAHYPVGTIIYPILAHPGDAGNYLYQVQSCSSSPCKTGTTEPDWSLHQQSTVAGMGTFNESLTGGNITWQAAPDVNNPLNTAVQDCRADVMIVRLSNSSGPSAQNSIIQGNVKVQGNVIIQ